MIITYHIPRKVGENLIAKSYKHKVALASGSGIVNIDSDSVTDAELADISLNRQKFNNVLAKQPRDIAAELDVLKAKIEKLETR